MDTLPTDILKDIFTETDIDDFATQMKTCKLWYNVHKDITFKTKLYNLWISKSLDVKNIQSIDWSEEAYEYKYRDDEEFMQNIKYLMKEGKEIAAKRLYLTNIVQTQKMLSYAIEFECETMFIDFIDLVKNDDFRRLYFEDAVISGNLNIIKKIVNTIPDDNIFERCSISKIKIHTAKMLYDNNIFDDNNCILIMYCVYLLQQNDITSFKKIVGPQIKPSEMLDVLIYYPDILKLLFECGFTWEANHQCCDVLEIFIREDNVQMIQTLIECGVDMNFYLPRYNSVCPLSYAVSKRNNKVAKVLLDTAFISKDRLSRCMSIAVESVNVEIMPSLINKGSTLQYIWWVIAQEYEYFDLLIPYYTDIDPNFLINAVRTRDIRKVSALLEKIDKEKLKKSGVLDDIIKYALNNVEIAKLLLRYGASNFVKNLYNYCLHRNLSYDVLDLIEFDPNESTGNKTLLMHFVEKNDIYMVRYLLNMGANTLTRYRRQRAEDMANEEIAALIRNFRLNKK